MYPAGGVHLSVLDWAKFITMQLEAENGGSTLLTPETAKVLHTPVDSGYALGWFVQPDYIWTNGVILTHNGFDGLDYAELWMSIKDNFAILVTTNSGSPEAPNIISNASAVLVHQFLPNQ